MNDRNKLVTVPEFRIPEKFCPEPLVPVPNNQRIRLPKPPEWNPLIRTPQPLDVKIKDEVELETQIMKRYPNRRRYKVDYSNDATQDQRVRAPTPSSLHSPLPMLGLNF